MNSLTGIKQVGFGNLTRNNNTAPRQELKKIYLLNKPIEDNISFGYGKTSRDKFKTLRAIAVKLGLPDFYTGKILTIFDNPTIEHLIPQGRKTRQHAKDIGLTSVNSLSNLVVVEAKVNHNERKSIPLKEWFRLHPEYLENAKKALKKYEEVNLREGELFERSTAIDGKSWAQRVKSTLNTELGYLAFTGRNLRQNKNLSYNA